MKPNSRIMTQQLPNWLRNTFLGLWLLLSASGAWAQPQLCAKEPSPKQPDYRVVQLICDPGPEFMPYRYGATSLAGADETLNDYYQVAYKHTSDKTALVASQKAWLKKRNACETKDCLNEVYHHRIIELTFLFGDSELHRKGIFAVDISPGFFAIKSEGLRNFDGGKQDYDLIDTEKLGKRNSELDCRVGSIKRLLGANLMFEEACNPPSRIIKSVDGRLLSRRPVYGSITGGSSLMKGVLHDGSRIYQQEREFIWGVETKANRFLWVPFHASIRRDDAQGQLVWQYYIVRKKASPEWPTLSRFWERNQRYGTVNLHSMLYLADKSVFVGGGGFRMNPITGELFEKNLLHRFTPTQVQQWTNAWTHDYLSVHPECQGALATCPNQPQASEYLRARFEAEMDQQFAKDAQ
jgi:hypothetical protein